MGRHISPKHICFKDLLETYNSKFDYLRAPEDHCHPANPYFA